MPECNGRILKNNFNQNENVDIFKTLNQNEFVCVYGSFIIGSNTSISADVFYPKLNSKLQVQHTNNTIVDPFVVTNIIDSEDIYTVIYDVSPLSKVYCSNKLQNCEIQISFIPQPYSISTHITNDGENIKIEDENIVYISTDDKFSVDENVSLEISSESIKYKTLSVLLTGNDKKSLKFEKTDKIRDLFTYNLSSSEIRSNCILFYSSSKDIDSIQPTPTPLPTPEQTLYQTPCQTPFNTIEQIFHQTPFETPEQTFHQTPFNTAEQTFHQTPFETPEQTFHQTPFETPEQTFHQTPFETPEQTFHQTPFETPEQTFHQTPFETPSYTPSPTDYPDHVETITATTYSYTIIDSTLVKTVTTIIIPLEDVKRLDKYKKIDRIQATRVEMNEIKAEIEESEDQDQVQDKYYADFISIGNTHEMNQLTVYADNVEDKKDSKNYISGNFTILLKTGIGAKKLSDLIITTQPKSIDNSTEKDKFPYLIVFLSAFGVIIISIVIAIVIFIFIRRNNQDDSSSGSIIESSSDVENPAVL